MFLSLTLRSRMCFRSGRIRRTDEGFSLTYLDSDSECPMPPLLVARSSEEAAEFCERYPDRVGTVYMDTARLERDEAALQRIHRGSASSVVSVPSYAIDVQRTLRDFGYQFLDWTPQLARQIAWASEGAGLRRPGDLGGVVRHRLRSKAKISTIESPTMDALAESLDELRLVVQENHTEELPHALQQFNDGSLNIFFGMLRAPVGFAESAILSAPVESNLEHMAQLLAGESRQWGGEVSQVARRLHATAMRAFEGLGRENPKQLALEEILGASPTARFCCGNLEWSALEARYGLDSGRRVLRSAATRGFASEPFVFFQWFGRDFMPRIRCPPTSSCATFVAYPMGGKAHRANYRTAANRGDQSLDDAASHHQSGESGIRSSTEPRRHCLAGRRN